MVGEIKRIVDVFTSALRGLTTFRGRKAERELFTNLLEAYFHFKAIAKNARILLQTAGSDPAGRVTKMSGKELNNHVVACHCRIVEQRMRLFRLNELIQAEVILDVFGQNFRERVDQVVGTKEHGLLGAAAAIEFYRIFGPMLSDRSDRAAYGKDMATYRYQARIVSLIGGSKEESRRLDIMGEKRNLKQLERTSEELRRIITERCEEALLIQVTRKASERSKLGERSRRKTRIS